MQYLPKLSAIPGLPKELPKDLFPKLLNGECQARARAAGCGRT